MLLRGTDFHTLALSEVITKYHSTVRIAGNDLDCDLASMDRKI
jgi:hypothetical protein